MVMRHRGAIDRLGGLWRLGDQARLPQQLVTLQDQFLIPSAAIVTDSDADAMLPVPSCRGVRSGACPAAQPSGDLLLKRQRSGAVILPWEVAIPTPPAHALLG